MASQIIKPRKARCVIISGSPNADIEFIKSEIRGGDYVICADSGYAHACRAGIKPDVIVGDFDSCEISLPDNAEIISLNTDKDFTDTLECAALALKRGFYEITILNALGGRTDHALGNIYALNYIAEHGGRAELLSRGERIALLCPGEHSFCGSNGLTFSVFPFACENACLSYSGARYPLDRYVMESAVPIGVSNVFTSDSASVTVHSGKAIIIINREKI